MAREQGYANNAALVTTEWVADHLNDPKARLIEVDVDTTAADLSQRLPAGERQHWAEHLLTPPLSRNFLSMRLAPGSCIDDGDLRDWN